MSEKVKLVFEWLFFAALILVIASNYNNNSEMEDKLSDVEQSVDLLNDEISELKSKYEELEFELQWK